MIFKPRIAVSIMVFSTPSDAVISKFNIKIEILFLVQKKKKQRGKSGGDFRHICRKFYLQA